MSNLPSSYTANGYNVYVYYNSNNGNAVTLNITGGSTTYGVCTANVTTFVLSNGSSAATQVPGDYVEWSGMSVPTFTASLTQAANGAGICGIEIVPNGGSVLTGGGGLNLLPVTTSVILASAATLDLSGGTQTVASLSDPSATPGSAGTILSSGTPTAILTLSPPSGSTTFSGLIGGSGSLGNLSLVMAGGGLQNLAGSNNYTGGTQVTGGTLQLGNANAIGTGALAANGGVFDLAGLAPRSPPSAGHRAL